MIDDTIEMTKMGYVKLRDKLAADRIALQIEQLKIERVRRLNRINKGVSTLEDEGLVEGEDVRKNENDMWVYINQFDPQTAVVNAK